MIGPFEPCKILLLEDDWILCHTLAKFLVLKGFTVVSPEKHESLFASLNIGDVKLIICDLSIPWLNTLDFCRLVRQTIHLKLIPFIFISGHGDPQTVHQCFEAGGDDFISKPFHIDELLASMEALFRICPGLGVT